MDQTAAANQNSQISITSDSDKPSPTSSVISIRTDPSTPTKGAIIASYEAIMADPELLHHDESLRPIMT